MFHVKQGSTISASQKLQVSKTVDTPPMIEPQAINFHNFIKCYKVHYSELKQTKSYFT